MEGACLEAENLTKGRFNGTCTATFTSVFKGLSAQVQLKIQDPDTCITVGCCHVCMSHCPSVPL